MLANEGSSSLLLVVEQNQSLLLSVRLEDLRADDRSMLLEVGHEIVLHDPLRESGYVDHFRRSATMAVVLRGVAVEAVEVRSPVLTHILRRCDVWILGVVHLEPFVEKQSALRRRSVGKTVD